MVEKILTHEKTFLVTLKCVKTKKHAQRTVVYIRKIKVTFIHILMGFRRNEKCPNAHSIRDYHWTQIRHALLTAW